MTTYEHYLINSIGLGYILSPCPRSHATTSARRYDLGQPPQYEKPKSPAPDMRFRPKTRDSCPRSLNKELPAAMASTTSKPLPARGVSTSTKAAVDSFDAGLVACSGL